MNWPARAGSSRVGSRVRRLLDADDGFALQAGGGVGTGARARFRAGFRPGGTDGRTIGGGRGGLQDWWLAVESVYTFVYLVGACW